MNPYSLKYLKNALVTCPSLHHSFYKNHSNRSRNPREIYAFKTMNHNWLRLRDGFNTAMMQWQKYRTFIHDVALRVFVFNIGLFLIKSL